MSSFRLTRHFKGYQKLVIDGDKFSHLERYHTSKGTVVFSLDKKSKRWKVKYLYGNNVTLLTLLKLEQVKSIERNTSTYGPIHRMYESKGALTIIIPGNRDHYQHVALQIAHDWYLYGRGDSCILYDSDIACNKNTGGYKIYLGLPSENKLIDQIISDKPCGIEFEKSTITGIKVGDKLYKDPGTGICKRFFTL